MARSEHVTILFTDLVGSTELAASRTPEAADALRRDHFSVLREAVEVHGGTEVKTLGDGLMVVFPASSSALDCAVAMQQGVDVANRRTTASLGLRVGIGAGEATGEDGDYFGDPVVEAARLCAAAESGQIVVSDLVRVSAGRRSSHALRALGALELKGLPEPVDSFEVAWRPLAGVRATGSDTALPSRLRLAPSIGVVGRDTEAQLLNDARKRVGAGDGREVVLIGGEPGMGKTTLAAQCARSAYDAGAWVLLGRSLEDLSAPYGPFGEALAHFVAHAPDELLDAYVAEQGAELARIAPVLRTRVASLPPLQSADPDAERYLLFGAVVALLARAAEDAPVVVVLDDVQWADTASLQLLRHLVTATDTGMRLLLVATYRDSELSATHPLTGTLAALRREPGVTRMDLKGLDDTGVIAFMEAAAGHPIPAADVGLAHALSRETDGNPFFVGEVLRNLAETGAISQDDTGRWSTTTDLADMDLPDSVREVVGSRVARLGEAAQQVLSLGSVIGREFELGLLAQVSERPEDDVLDILDAAIAGALVQEAPDHPGRYSFSHALIQHTLYADLGATRRARAHRKVAETLEATCGDDPGDLVGELAYHWASATQPVDLQKAMSYARQAGERALAALAPDEAVRHFGQALRLAEQQPVVDVLLRLDVLLGLGTAQRQSGRPEFRETLLEAARLARELGDSNRLAEAALANSRGIFSVIGLVDHDRVEVLEAALAALPDRDTAVRARLLARLCSELTWASLEQRLALAAEAKSMARRLGDIATLLEVLNDCAVSLRVPAALEELLADEIGLLDALDPNGVNPSSLYWLCEQAHCEAVRAGRFDVTDRCLTTMTEIAHRLGQPMLLWNLATIGTTVAVRRGELDEAERLLEEARAMGAETGQPDAYLFYSAQLCNVRYHQGRMEELIDFLTEVMAVSPSSTAPSFRGGLALGYLQGGREDEARTFLETMVRDELDTLQYDVVWLNTIVSYSEIAFWLDATEAARRLLDVIAPFDDQITFEGCDVFDPVATVLGGLATVLGRFDEAESWFDKAIRLCEPGGMPKAIATAKLCWGRMLLRRAQPGDRARAIKLLREAQSTAADRGFRFVEQRASAELQRAG